MEELRATLSVLKESAASEDAKDFDPSGSSAQHEDSSTGGSPGRASSWHGFSLTEDTELTRSSRWPESSPDVEGEQQSEDGVSTLSIQDRTEKELPLLGKLELLAAMFPTIKEFDRKFALKKAEDDFHRAVEDLLNQAFLEEEGVNNGTTRFNRGIQGFADFETPETHRGRKARGKRKKQTRRTSSTPGTDTFQSEPSPQSRWDQAKKDVDYLAERVHLPRQSISSIYHESGALLPRTIVALCASSESMTSNSFLLSASSSVLEAHSFELAFDFPTLSHTHLGALVRMTHPSTASAHELAKAMLSSPESSTAIIPQYLARPPSPSSLMTESTSSPLPLSVRTVGSLATARSNAFIQANAAYRKSKSKPLMGGAAAYYSSIGRDAAAGLAQHEAAVANALVAGQSNADEIDLHGVNVKDAVRITRTRVQAWWDGGAAEWARQGRVQGDGGFRVVTGIGRHSAGGKSRLGPAVGAMLVREGWKVEVGDGVVTVRGKARR